MRALIARAGPLLLDQKIMGVIDIMGPEEHGGHCELDCADVALNAGNVCI